MVKTCTKCHTLRPLVDFHPRNEGRPGRYTSHCKLCTRARNASKMREKRALDPEAARAKFRADYKKNPDRHRLYTRRSLLKTYGLTPETFDAQVRAQGGRCGVCADLATLVVDHDHARTDPHFRGLLCSPCNTGLGSFRDSPERLEAAIAYLKRPR